MERLKPLLPFVVIFFFFGVGGLFRFSQHVRTVDAVGLFGSGMASGAAVFGFITALRARMKA